MANLFHWKALSWLHQNWNKLYVFKCQAYCKYKRHYSNSMPFAKRWLRSLATANTSFCFNSVFNAWCILIYWEVQMVTIHLDKSAHTNFKIHFEIPYGLFCCWKASQFGRLLEINPFSQWGKREKHINILRTKISMWECGSLNPAQVVFVLCILESEGKVWYRQNHNYIFLWLKT